jgi:hypothetical protein
MTTGSFSRPGNALQTTFRDWSGDACAGSGSWTVSNSNIQYWGLIENRTWNGTDRPLTPPIYDRFYYTMPTAKGRRQFSVKQRRRLPGGAPYRVEEDHPYTMSMSQSRFTISYRTIYTSFICYIGPGLGNRIVTIPTRVADGSSSIYGGASWSGTWTSNDDIALLGRLREKIVGSDFDATVFLGEGREALSMIFNGATKIRKSLSALKRGDVLKAAKEFGILPDDSGRILSVRRQTTGQGPRYIPKKIPPTVGKGLSEGASKIWLEWSYGWSPLLQDVASAAQFLAAHLEAGLHKEYRTSLKVKLKATQSQKYQSWKSNGYIRTSLIARLTEIDSVKLLGFTDPAAVLWEITPWSFVADWFIPVGNYLQARGLAQSLRGTFVTTKVEHRYEEGSGLPNDYDLQGRLTNTYSGVYYSRKSVNMSRTVSTNLKVPLPSFKNLGDVPSWKRAANAVALLVGQFGSTSILPNSRRSIY